MTPTQSAFVLEPYWCAAEISMDRLAELRRSAVDSPDPGQDTYQLLHAIHRAEDFILAIARRLDARHLDAIALENQHGAPAIWPTRTSEKDQAAAINRWLDRNPEIAKRRAERVAAFRAKVEASVGPLRTAAAAAESAGEA